MYFKKLNTKVYFNLRLLFISILDLKLKIKCGNDRLTIQKVPPEIYLASYPAWFFDMNRFLSYFQDQYEIVVQFDALAGAIELKKPYAIAQDRGFLLRRKESENASD